MIEVDGVTIVSGTFRLEDCRLTVPSRRYGVLTGRTGCGKTTILEAIAGLRQVAAGSIRLDDRDVTRAKPAERNVGYVPQDGALFHTMTVRDQLAFPLAIRRCRRPDIAQRVKELAELLSIGHLLDRYPAGLSGGERQRVAIGRALSFQPQTLLLDEPLSALDDETRAQMYELLRHVQRETMVTTLHVTHHREDVAELADILLRLDQGKVEVLSVRTETPGGS